MKIESTAFKNDEEIPKKYTCDGESILPPLAWSSVPAGSKSLALIVEDPDAPRGIFDHLVLWNIPPSLSGLGEETISSGVMGKNSLGTKTYIAPCPSFGMHRYIFTLFALDTLLLENLCETKNELLSAMQGHIIEKTEITGLYQKI